MTSFSDVTRDTVVGGRSGPPPHGLTWRFVSVAALFVTCLIASNTIAGKIVVVAGAVVPAGVIVFPVSYILGDVLTEVWGYAATRRVIWLAFVCNALMVTSIWLAGRLPPAPMWNGQAAWDRIFDQTPRILVASFLAYLVGEFANAFVLAKLKLATGGRWLWTRTVGSTLVGQALDTAIFIAIAFGGVLAAGAMLSVMLGQWLVKVVYEALATPLTYAVVGWLKSREHVDAFDEGVDFNPIRL